jgi:hypothetical protein
MFSCADSMRASDAQEMAARKDWENSGTPSPLPCFLEVLILEELERDFSEVLILGDFKSNVENEIQTVLEVLILEGLKFDFSEVLILEGLRVKNGRTRVIAGTFCGARGSDADREIGAAVWRRAGDGRLQFMS